jgi:hypothetical protein
VILLFSLVCPDRHPVCGEPKEYPGTAQPPEPWIDNMSRAFWESLPDYPPSALKCDTCGREFAHGKTKGWGVVCDEMKADTIEQAERDLMKASEAVKVRP